MLPNMKCPTPSCPGGAFRWGLFRTLVADATELTARLEADQVQQDTHPEERAVMLNDYGGPVAHDHDMIRQQQ